MPGGEYRGEAPMAIAVSPHQDDAVFARGGDLQRYDEVKVLNVFTRSTAHMLDLPDDVDLISGIRQSEDEAVSRDYGFQFVDAGFPDSEVRGVAWNDTQAEVDPELFEGVVSWLSEQLENTEPGKYDLYLPAAFGLHPDHYLALLAATSPEVLRKVHAKSLRIYADEPYYHEGHQARHGATDLLTVRDRDDAPFDQEAKAQMLRHYPSQATAERVRLISGFGAEHSWNISPDLLPQFVERVKSRRRVKESSVFSKPEWLTSTAKVYESDGTRFVEVPVENANGESLLLPISVDTHEVPGVGEVTMARHTGSHASDYMDFDGVELYDKQALDQLTDALRSMGVGALWLSGIREDYPLAAHLRAPDEKPAAELFHGIPLHRTLCRESFQAWLDNLHGSARKNIRNYMKREQQLETAVEALGGAVKFSVSRATAESLDTMLDLQAKRSTEKDSLDSLQSNQQYNNLLHEAASQGLLSTAELKAGDEVISSLLVDVDEESRSIAIIAQGFNSEWSEWSPSMVNMLKVIEYAHDSGYEYVDFLRGDEPYKRYFTDQTLALYKYVELLNAESGDFEKIISYVKGYEE